MSTTNTPQLLPRSLVNSWELEESQGARGGFAAHFLCSLPSDSSVADAHPLLSDILPGRGRPSLPLLLFLSHRHLWVLKIDFGELTASARKSPDVHHSSWSRLVRVPLGSVVVHFGQSGAHIGDGDGISRCADPRHHRRYLLGDKIWLLVQLRKPFFYCSIVVSKIMNIVIDTSLRYLKFEILARPKLYISKKHNTTENNDHFLFLCLSLRLNQTAAYLQQQIYFSNFLQHFSTLPIILNNLIGNKGQDVTVGVTTEKLSSLPRDKKKSSETEPLKLVFTLILRPRPIWSTTVLWFDNHNPRRIQ